MVTAFPTVKLADCVDLLAGFAFKSQQFTDRPDDIPLVKGENVSQGCILWEISKRWSAADWPSLEKYQLRAGDVVVAMDRPWVPAGLKWAYIRSDDPKALLVQRCSRLRSNTPKLNQDFLRFVIGGPGFESYVIPITTGVNVPHISGKQILDYEFALPPLPVQQRIAGILSAYDELIENSQRRIKILEAMARALYREWFVHFRFPGHDQPAAPVGTAEGCPEGVSARQGANQNHPRIASPLGEIPQGWEVLEFRDIFDIRYGKTLPKTEISDSGPYQKRALSQPMFYLSEYLEMHREEYYQRLKAISVEGDWNGWLAFFLRAIATQAAQNSTRVTAIQTLYEEMKLAIQAATHSQYTVHVLDAIFNKPIFRSSDLTARLFQEFGIHEKTTPGLLRQMKEAGILRELQAGSGRRPATLCFPRLINLAEGRDVI